MRKQGKDSLKQKDWDTYLLKNKKSIQIKYNFVNVFKSFSNTDSLSVTG